MNKQASQHKLCMQINHTLAEYSFLLMQMQWTGPWIGCTVTNLNTCDMKMITSYCDIFSWEFSPIQITLSCLFSIIVATARQPYAWNIIKSLKSVHITLHSLSLGHKTYNEQS